MRRATSQTLGLAVGRAVIDQSNWVTGITGGLRWFELAEDRHPHLLAPLCKADDNGRRIAIELYREVNGEMRRAWMETDGDVAVETANSIFDWLQGKKYQRKEGKPERSKSFEDGYKRLLRCPGTEEKERLFQGRGPNIPGATSN